MPLQNSFSPGFSSGFGRDKPGEIVIQVFEHPKYETGDILEAYNERATLHNWAEKYCHVRRSGGGRGLCRDYDSLAWHMQQTFYKYKITRVSTYEAIRENIDPTDPDFGTLISLREPYWEITVEGFATESHWGDTRVAAVESYLASVGATGYTVAGQGAQIHVFDGSAQEVALTMTWMNEDTMMRVPLFFNRRLTHDLHRVFVDDQGRFVYFGGKQDCSETNVHSVWDVIEAKDTTPFPGRLTISRMHHRTRQFPAWMKKKFLLLTVDNLTDEETSDLTTCLYDTTDPDNPVRVKERKHFIDFENIAELTPQQVKQIKNPRVITDMRAVTRVNMKVRKKVKTLA